MTNKAVAKQLAEEAAYSAKGHFKSSDWVRVSLSVYIFVPFASSLVLSIFSLQPQVIKVISTIGLLFGALALHSSITKNPEKTNDLVQKHMRLGNEYLALYKQIRTGVAIENINLVEWENIINQLDAQTSKLRISYPARVWARLTINKEVDLKWIEEEDKNPPLFTSTGEK